MTTIYPTKPPAPPSDFPALETKNDPYSTAHITHCTIGVSQANELALQQPHTSLSKTTNRL